MTTVTYYVLDTTHGYCETLGAYTDELEAIRLCLSYRLANPLSEYMVSTVRDVPRLFA